jgi:hypothetical protein
MRLFRVTSSSFAEKTPKLECRFQSHRRIIGTSKSISTGALSGRQRDRPAILILMSHSEKPIPRSITARPSPEEKLRFATLAAICGLSEAALAMKVIRAVLDAKESLARTSAAAGARAAATDRITIRLRPGDGSAIASRAAMRGTKASAYLAALVRAHVVTNPPLAAQELSALKYSVAVLGDISGHLVRALRNSSAGDIRDALQRTQAAVAALEQRTHDFAKAALISWESRSD